ncbi:sugar phosphate permease [Kibdelosporangium banguiense]|uniref:Sugar phosphate permease n=1 Tax=Kibdelosporangium banguiense TaxID=1365924 RepID=A0ABS4T9S8_9PSEU|nr:MFS transporter [Kibdelosporangium banguiense]MBP2320591.1 sugar phosphate permease [Kibdelosporangium banguiense]
MTQLEVRTRRVHWAWWVAGVAFISLLGAAGFRAAPSVLIDPLHQEFGWSRGTISFAVSVNLVLYGLISPFAAALMERLGMRKVVAGALALVAAGAGLTVFMTASWQLVLFWGIFVGVGTGSMAMAFVATVTSRWFVKHRGLVSGVLTAAGATGQLIFLPVVANMATDLGWRPASLVIAAVALLVVPIVLIFLRDHPHDVGTTALGAETDEPPPVANKGAARRALQVLGTSVRSGTFWMLAGGFAICGASTNGLVGTHFVPAAHDHGVPMTTAAGLLALVGIFDVAGTIFSGWLTDRIDPRWLLGAYYALRGGSLLLLPHLFGPTVEPPMWAFIIFYGLDWVATVPPTVALCRDKFGVSGPIVFGWVFASHQLGAAVAAFAAGTTRDHLGSYDLAWYGAGALCMIAALLSISIRRTPTRM